MKFFFKNKERLFWIILTVTILAISFKTPFLKDHAFAESAKSIEKYYDHFGRVVQTIQRFYVDKDKVDVKKLIYGAIKGMLQTLDDPHTAFLDKRDFTELTTETSGKFGGLGIYISKRDGWITVISPIEGTPAWKVGVKPGDIITEIEGKSTKGITIDYAVKKLRGKAGTYVNISVARSGESHPLHFKIKRDIINIDSVKSGMIKKTKIGYIRVLQFSAKTAVEMKKAIKKLKSKKANAFIIDLRNNPGGLLNVAIDTVDLFIDKGLIVYTKDRMGRKEEFKAKRSIAVPKSVPMIVLVNGYSASASEIFTGAMQDYKRAIVIGEKTYGKFSVQQVFPIDRADGTAFRMTMAYYYTPKGRNLHKKGLTPDIEVKQKLFSLYEGKMIKRAISTDFIKNYVESNNTNTIRALNKLLIKFNALNIDLSMSDLTLLIKREREKNKMPELYDLEYDDQLNYAINVLKGVNILEKK